MDSLIYKYLDTIGTAYSQSNLAEYTGRFLKSQNLVENFAIIKHDLSPNPHHILFTDHNLKIGPEYIQNFCDLNLPIKPFQDISINGNHFIFWDYNYADAPGCYLYSKSTISHDVNDIIKYWQAFASLIQNVIVKSNEEKNLSTGSIISQIMHDIHSLINIINTDASSEGARSRASYQEKVNHDLLFWIRDLETLKSQVNLKEVIESSLSLINVNWQNLKAFQVASEYEIIVDVELFSKAFNEIVKNAIDGTDGDLNKIEISVEVEPLRSPFFNFNWFKISVSDEGTGIASDYLEHIKNPFFTTKKQDGKGGFGLSIAEKIIHIHKGTMNIDSQRNEGTKVDLYLPGIKK